LQIPKHNQKSVNGRRPGNITAKRKKDKRTNKDLQNTTQKLNMSSTKPLKTGSELSSGSVRHSVTVA
jgi:hypothetical protein